VSRAGHIIIFLVVTVLLFACKKDDAKNEPQPERYGTTEGRTVLVYAVADNNMSSQASTDIKEMLVGAKYMSDKDHLVVYLDDASEPRIYDVTFGCAGKKLQELTPIYQFDTEVNSCTYDQLKWVLQYTVEHYKAASYGLVMWSHGNGWIPVYPSMNEKTYGVKTRSFGVDNSNDKKTGYKMDIDEIAQAINDVGMMDFIIFDACFMQSIEVLYTLRNVAKAIISSPAEVPGDGAPYHTILKPMYSDNNYVEGMVDTYYEAYRWSTSYGILLSAVDCSKLEAFAQVTRPYVQKYKQKLLEAEYVNGDSKPTILDYYWYDYYTGVWGDYCYPDFFDIKGLMMKVMDEEDMTEWLTELDKIIIKSAYTNTWFSDVMSKTYKTVDGKQYSGVAMHVPLKKYAEKYNFRYYAGGYYDTPWAQAVWE